MEDIFAKQKDELRSLITASRKIEELMRSFETEFDEYFDQAKLDEAREELAESLKPFKNVGVEHGR